MLACHTVRLNQCLRPVRPCAVAVAAASPATPAVGRPMLLVLVSQFSCEESEMCSEIQHVKVCSIPLGPSAGAARRALGMPRHSLRCPEAQVLKSQVRATQATACHCHAVLLRTIAVPGAVRAPGPASRTVHHQHAGAQAHCRICRIPIAGATCYPAAERSGSAGTA